MDYMDHKDVIRRIKTSLQKRSGKSWSVTQGSGTALLWICIRPLPKRLQDERITPEDAIELAGLLGLEPSKIHPQGVSIPPQDDYYQEYIDRAEGRTPSVFGVPDWD